jgi:hypothetical protein
MLINEKDIQPGTQVLCDARGLLATVVSVLMWLFIPYWRTIKRKPFHVGFISRKDPNKGWMMCEAIAGGIVETSLKNYDTQYMAFYQWFDTPPSEDCINRYLKDHLGCKYDVLIYFWTIAAEFASILFRRNIGRWDNDSYDCWENLEEFDELCGKPLCKAHRTIMITDFCRELGVK